MGVAQNGVFQPPVPWSTCPDFLSCEWTQVGPLFAFRGSFVFQGLTPGQAGGCVLERAYQTPGETKKMRKLLLGSVAMAAVAMAASSASAGTWVTATAVQNSVTFAVFGITNGSIIAGDYTDSSGFQHGFVGPSDGSNFTSFDDPGGVTQPRGISQKGWIAGFDSSSTATWERSPSGTLNPVTKNGNALNGVAQGLNRTGTFGADYIDSTGTTVPYTGKRYKFANKFVLSIPNTGSAIRGVDAAGDMVGWFYDPNTGLQHGFISIGGTQTQVDVPNATYTVFEGINDRGIATGQFEDSSNAIHGFYYKISTGKFKQLDAPGAATTQVWGLNNHDVITASVPGAGSYYYCIHATGCPAPSKGHVINTPGKGKPAVP
ncbi:MAG TPA: hypothetical protein VGI20_05675 [Rhizomicrobium sp.]